MPFHIHRHHCGETSAYSVCMSSPGCMRAICDAEIRPRYRSSFLQSMPGGDYGNDRAVQSLLLTQALERAAPGRRSGPEKRRCCLRCF